ncbi:MAG TPA: hypothetical protein PKU79_10160 [Mesotoga sp.]|nr:hypothetical protein [Mesotoga sp.]
MFNGLDAGLEEVLKRIMETASLNDLQEVKARYLGKQGLVTSLMKNIKEFFYLRRAKIEAIRADKF